CARPPGYYFDYW
nr:immunoglobulin heavy chain junction region [Mus musculus]MBK4189052.1 immunoglobulin heavy chain junction region [Mus musculus]